MALKHLHHFWDYVDRGSNPDECWCWTDQTQKDGYGFIDYGGRQLKRRVLTHRYAWELTNGPIPKGLFVCHKCDNRPCCRPDHLFLGTNIDNLADMTAKGRRAIGSAIGTAKVTEDTVREIRRLCRSGEATQGNLARRFGIAKQTVSAIMTGQNWSHVVDVDGGTITEGA